MTIRVFMINENDYCAGDCTPQEILDFYMKLTGCTHEESTGDEDDLPIELSEEYLTNHVLYDPEVPVQTFRKYLDYLIKCEEYFPLYFCGVD